MSIALDPGSFRDPSGFVFCRENTVFRQVQIGYRDEYDRLMNSGLYQALVEAGLLISHTEEPSDSGLTRNAYRVLRPEQIPFISYPYEWCFSQLRDAALATLSIQREALRFGMSLKDASAYNVQFRAGRPVLIDTLSFEIYEEGRPWAAYRQFCQHFLAPLALMSRTDVRLGQLLRTDMDGIPLDLASRLLPRSTWLSPGLLMHVHLHGAAQKRYGGQPVRGSAGTGRMGRTALLGLMDSLEGAVRRLRWSPSRTTWADYYNHTNYSSRAMEGKRRLVAEMLDAVEPQPGIVWDLGANTGIFSRLAGERGAQTIACDIDPGAVEKNYLECRSAGETRVLPLLVDFTNPSPDIGWALQERRSLLRRGPADLILALAFVHHLAIGNNVPLGHLARFLREIGGWLIVEFVPKSDSQAQRLLASREDIFPDYSREGFEAEFLRFFEIVRFAAVPDSERTLYLMRGRALEVES
jgi:hypothetical protein